MCKLDCTPVIFTFTNATTEHFAYTTPSELLILMLGTKAKKCCISCHLGSPDRLHFYVSQCSERRDLLGRVQGSTAVVFGQKVHGTKTYSINCEIQTLEQESEANFVMTKICLDFNLSQIIISPWNANGNLFIKYLSLECWLYFRF